MTTKRDVNAAEALLSMADYMERLQRSGDLASPQASLCERWKRIFYSLGMEVMRFMSVDCLRASDAAVALRVASELCAMDEPKHAANVEPTTKALLAYVPDALETRSPRLQEATKDDIQKLIRKAQRLLEEVSTAEAESDELLEMVDFRPELPTAPRSRRVEPRSDAERATDENASWEKLAALQPDLKVLSEAIARLGVERTERFCANRLWYVVYKPLLVRLVGWGTRYSEDHVLGSQRAYEVVYEHCYALLPPCRDCGE